MRYAAIAVSVASMISCAARDFHADHILDPLTPAGALIWQPFFCWHEAVYGQPVVDGSGGDFPSASVISVDPSGDVAVSANDVTSISFLQDGSLLYIYAALGGAPSDGRVTFLGTGLGNPAELRFSSGSASVSGTCPSHGADIGMAAGASGVEIFVRPSVCLPRVNGHAIIQVQVPVSTPSDFASSCDVRWGF